MRRTLVGWMSEPRRMGSLWLKVSAVWEEIISAERLYDWGGRPYPIFNYSLAFN
jgi:hypothetical protein